MAWNASVWNEIERHSTSHKGELGELLEDRLELGELDEDGLELGELEEQLGE